MTKKSSLWTFAAFKKAIIKWKFLIEKVHPLIAGCFLERTNRIKPYGILEHTKPLNLEVFCAFLKLSNILATVIFDSVFLKPQA
ncbi:MAG: hypothetical protein V4547_13860 [Bacteroidota bacterium]